MSRGCRKHYFPLCGYSPSQCELPPLLCLFLVFAYSLLAEGLRLLLSYCYVPEKLRQHIVKINQHME